MVTNGTSRHAALMKARCSVAAVSGIDGLAQLRRERRSAERTAEIDRARGGVLQRRVNRRLDDARGGGEVLLLMPAAQPVEQHRGREDERGRVCRVLPLD